MIHLRTLVDSFYPNHTRHTLIKIMKADREELSKDKDIPEHFTPYYYFFIHTMLPPSEHSMTALHLVDESFNTYMEHPYDDWDNHNHSYASLVEQARVKLDKALSSGEWRFD